MISRRRERLFTRWDERGGPGRFQRWWLVSPARWVLAGLVTGGLLVAIFTLIGDPLPAYLLFGLPLMVLSGVTVAAALHDEWLAQRTTGPGDAGVSRAMPRWVLGAAQAVLVFTVVGLVVLTVRGATPPDDRAIAEAIGGEPSDLVLLPADEEATSQGEVSTHEAEDGSWVAATLGSDGLCYVYRFEAGETVQAGRARDPQGGCTAEVAAAQLEDTSA